MHAQDAAAKKEVIGLMPLASSACFLFPFLLWFSSPARSCTYSAQNDVVTFMHSCPHQLSALQLAPAFQKKTEQMQCKMTAGAQQWAALTVSISTLQQHTSQECPCPSWSANAENKHAPAILPLVARAPQQRAQPSRRSSGSPLTRSHLNKHSTLVPTQPRHSLRHTMTQRGTPIPQCLSPAHPPLRSKRRWPGTP
jgi:hypothetical protein